MPCWEHTGKAVQAGTRKEPTMATLHFFFFPNKRIACWIFGIFFFFGRGVSGEFGCQEKEGEYWLHMVKSPKPEAQVSGISSPRPRSSFLSAFPTQASHADMERHSRRTAWPDVTPQSEQHEGNEHL